MTGKEGKRGGKRERERERERGGRERGTEWGVAHENRRVVGEEEEESRRGYKYTAPPAANVHQLTYRPDQAESAVPRRQTAAKACAEVALARISMLRYRAESVRHVVRLDLKLWDALKLQY